MKCEPVFWTMQCRLLLTARCQMFAMVANRCIAAFCMWWTMLPRRPSQRLNLPVLWVMLWVNIIPMATVLYTRLWSAWDKIFPWAKCWSRARVTLVRAMGTRPPPCVIQRHGWANWARPWWTIWTRIRLTGNRTLTAHYKNQLFCQLNSRISW